MSQAWSQDLVNHGCSAQMHTGQILLHAVLTQEPSLSLVWDS
jgi:hypothetical protein